MIPAVRLADDSDMLRYEPRLEDVCPRFDRDGARLNDWDQYHGLASARIERDLRVSRSTDDVFDIGRLGFRSREHLRDVAACWALHFLYVASDAQGDIGGYFSRKAAHYQTLAKDMFEGERSRLDYDLSDEGDISTQEQQRPFPSVFIRG